ncbi:MAG: hypothetical protein OEM52_10440 [bacterium]|nr:hypothetical protein [bacterium]
MGQQQLLLIVLGVIIVGIAVVVGINLFGSSAKQANEDAVVQECLGIISASQQWVRKPTALGGPAAQNDYTNFDFSIIGKSVAAGTLTWSNANNDAFVISARGVNTYTLTGTGREGAVVTYTGITATTVPTPTITR